MTTAGCSFTDSPESGQHTGGLNYGTIKPIGLV